MYTPGCQILQLLLINWIYVCIAFKIYLFKGEIENSIAALRDVPWDSYTLPYGWGQQGIWSRLPDGTHFHTLCRSSSKKFMVRVVVIEVTT